MKPYLRFEVLPSTAPSRILEAFEEPVQNGTIQFECAPTDRAKAAIAEVLENQPRIELRLYGEGDGGGPELAWLHGLENAHHVSIGASRIVSFDHLVNFTEVRSLRLMPTNSVRSNLRFLSALSRLTKLILDGQFRDFATVCELSRLTDLRLASPRQTDLSPIKELKAVERFSLSWGPNADVDFVADLPRLRELRLTFLPKFTHEGLHAIAQHSSLASLEIWRLKRLSRLHALRDSRIRALFITRCPLEARQSEPADGATPRTDGSPSDGSLAEVIAAMPLEWLHLSAAADVVSGVPETFRGDVLILNGELIKGNESKSGELLEEILGRPLT